MAIEITRLRPIAQRVAALEVRRHLRQGRWDCESYDVLLQDTETGEKFVQRVQAAEWERCPGSTMRHREFLDMKKKAFRPETYKVEGVWIAEDNAALIDSRMFMLPGPPTTDEFLAGLSECKDAIYNGFARVHAEARYSDWPLLRREDVQWSVHIVRNSIHPTTAELHGEEFRA